MIAGHAAIDVIIPNTIVGSKFKHVYRVIIGSSGAQGHDNAGESRKICEEELK
jgi:hypothetical protein